MLRFRNFFLILLFATVACLPRPSRAAIEPTYDLSSLCFMSTDCVEVELVRHHYPGQEEWKDTFTATVLASLEGKYQAKDQIAISNYPLWLYQPTRTGMRCILFLTRQNLQLSQDASLPLVDMLLIDSHGRVRRYFQVINPGPMRAEGYRFDNQTGQVQESDATEQKYPTLAEERALIAAKWVAAKKLKAPPYQVLHHTER